MREENAVIGENATVSAVAGVRMRVTLSCEGSRASAPYGFLA